jgi:YesN/AraC family two-component response regulator
MSQQILVVDDDSEFRQEMCECLHNYRVIEAANGLEALKILKKPNAIDLVILDFVMPQMTGTEVLRQIKTNYPHLSVIMLTGQSSKDVAIEALKGRADDYVEKPFEVERFLSTIQKILESKKKSASGYLNKMDRVKMFLENNCDKKINLNHVAEEVCLSPKYLSRLFKENSGTGFNEYRLKIKIEKAEELLKSTDFTINQIAIQLGYKNPESFIRMFEKLLGSTPTEYRVKHRDKKRKK